MQEKVHLTAIETKFFIRALDFTRGSEEDRVRIGGLVKARLLYGPLSIEKIESTSSGTRVWFVLRFRLEGDFLNIRADFEGYDLFPVGLEAKDVSESDFQKNMVEGLSPYVQEMVAYITGKAGMSPMILPLPSSQFLSEEPKP